MDERSAGRRGSAQKLLDVMVQVFTESEVRSSLVFQLSKLCSLLLKASRLSVGGAAWDALVAGALIFVHKIFHALLRLLQI